jgi:hypothetical protein
MSVVPGFQQLAERLIYHLNQRVSRGEMSERSLARLTRYSQPHIHNVLKGSRALTAELADQVLQQLGIPLVSLLTQEELSGLGPPAVVDFLPAPVLDGRLGAGNAFPKMSGETSRYFLPSRVLSAAVSPVVARLDAHEDSMSPLLEPGDWVLLDRSPTLRRRPQFGSAYALSWKEVGFVARCRVVGDALVLVADNARQSVDVPNPIPLAGRNILDVVKGKIVWVGREL